MWKEKLWWEKVSKNKHDHTNRKLSEAERKKIEKLQVH